MGVRTLLVGGVSGTHDALLAATLAGRGIAAEAIGVPDARALQVGRSLLARGHCHPTYYLSGALVERLRRELAVPGATAATLVERFAHLTVGSCGPCRFATYAQEHRRALAAAGFAGLPVLSIDQLRPGPSPALAAAGATITARLLASLAAAAIAADVIVRAGCQERPGSRDPQAVDEVLAGVRRQVGAALARGRSALPALRALGTALRAIPRAQADGPRVRVRLIGEFFAAHTDGSGGFGPAGIVRWLEARGAIVEPPAVADWLRYLAWQVRSDVTRRIDLFRPDGGPRGLAGRDGSLLLRRAGAAERVVGRLYSRAAAAAGVRATLIDMDDAAALAASHYHPELRAGMGHLEVAAFLAAERDGSADLVLAIKPFGCLPSSALSDGVLPALARRARRAAFASIETTGDAEALVESRLELALEGAALLSEQRGHGGR